MSVEENVKRDAASAGDLWSGIALALFALFTILQASRWDYLGPDGPGAGFYPLWIGIAMLALSAVLIVQNLRAGPSRSILPGPGVRRALTAWAALALGVAALALVGFVIGFALLAFFVVAAIHRRPLQEAVVVAILATGGFYAVFVLGLGVALPAGPLGF